MILSEYEAVIESILFLSGDIVSLSDIAKLIDLDTLTAKSIIESLKEKLDSENRGIRIIDIDDGYQMCTSPECFSYIKKIYDTAKRPKITPVLLETLSIIAYKQPVTKSEIEEIRGVNSDHALNKLMEYGLICETGRSESVGRPILFGTTDEFLRYYGFKSKDDLPPLK